MAEYGSPQIRELRAQLLYAPREVRSRHVHRLEQLLPGLNANRSYPYEYIVYRITGFRIPPESDGPPAAGTPLRAELMRLLDDLTYGLREPANDPSDPVLGLSDVSDRCRVCARTLRRWRQEGLPLRWFAYPDRRLGRGVRLSAFQQFLRCHRHLVQRGARFSRLTEAERLRAIELARRLRADGDAGITEVTRKTAALLGRAPETLRSLLRHHDLRNPADPLFPPQKPRLSESDRQQIVRSREAGVSMRLLCARHGRSRSALYAALRAEKVSQILKRRIRYVPHPDFDRPNAERRILSEKATQLLCPPITVAEREKDADAYVAAVSHMPVLSAEQERDLFRRYNYLKRRMARAQQELRQKGYRAPLVRAFESTEAAARVLRNQLIQCNLRLVASIARRHAGPLVGFSDLMSTGSLVLMRAVESFDCSRGNRFSTYLTWAVSKEYARRVPEENYWLATFLTGEQQLAQTADRRVSQEGLHREAIAHLRHLLSRAVGALSALEREVITARFGLGGAPPRTLREIGNAHGLTGERIRQIQNDTLQKLRQLLGPDGVEAIPG